MFRYIDLFSGIGGFHQGVDRVSRDLGIETECIFASDNDFYASQVYLTNYGINSYYDITEPYTHELISEKVGNDEVTFLFGGFPCQPFSKAGIQQGFNDPTKGTLFWEIKRIIEDHKPIMILLENVRNLKSHDNGNTWKIIRKNLNDLGYYVEDFVLSPNEISNIPALRERFYITAYHMEKANISKFQNGFGVLNKRLKTSILCNFDSFIGLDKRYFENGVDSDIDEHRKKVIDMWNELVISIKKVNKKLISPLWPYYFDEKISIDAMPLWKQKIVNRNRRWYKENKKEFDMWYNRNMDFFESLNNSQKKFEWNAGDEIDDVWKGIIQFRPSGVRVKKSDFIPTLVAINQTPIIGIEKRYIKPSEISKLYGFENLDFGNQPESQTFKQLGNTVSVDVVAYIIHSMLKKCGIGEFNYDQEN